MGGGGGGKVPEVRTPAAYELAGFDSQEAWDQHKAKVEQDQKDRDDRQNQFYSDQIGIMHAQTELASKSFAAQQDALNKAQAAREAEAAEIKGKMAKRLAAAGKGKATLLTSGQGLTTAAPVLKKTLGG